MRPIDRRLFTVAYGHAPYVAPYFRGVGFAEADEAAASDAYASGLKAELQPLITTGEVHTNRRTATDTSGPGADVDNVALLVSASALAGGSAGWRTVAQDLRSIMGRLRELGDGRVRIDEYTAEILAVDHVSQDAELVDANLRYVARLRGADDADTDPERGFLVGLQVDGNDAVVVVSVEGEIVGVSKGVDLDGVAALGV